MVVYTHTIAGQLTCSTLEEGSRMGVRIVGIFMGAHTHTHIGQTPLSQIALSLGLDKVAAKC